MPEPVTVAGVLEAERSQEANLFATSFNKAVLTTQVKIVVVGQKPAANTMAPLGSKVDLEVGLDG